MERVKVKRRAPSLRAGVFQCLEVGAIRRSQQKKVRRKQPRGGLCACLQGQRKPPGEGSDPVHQRGEGEEDGGMRRVTGCGNSAAGRKARWESVPGGGSQAEKTTHTDNASKDSAVKGSRQSAVKAKQGQGRVVGGGCVS